MNRTSTTYYLYSIVIVLTITFYWGCADAFSHHRHLSTTNKCGLKKQIQRLRASEKRTDEQPAEILEEIEAYVDDDDDEKDDLVDAVTARLEEMSGLWYSDNFYGTHGREWVKVSATIVGETARSALEATKVTGDPNVPAGCVTFRTGQWPGVGETVTAQIQVRANPDDPNGFSWLTGYLTLVANDQLMLACQYNLLMRSEGTFYREKKEGEEEN